MTGFYLLSFAWCIMCVMPLIYDADFLLGFLSKTFPVNVFCFQGFSLRGLGYPLTYFPLFLLLKVVFQSNFSSRFWTQGRQCNICLNSVPYSVVRTIAMRINVHFLNMLNPFSLQEWYQFFSHTNVSCSLSLSISSHGGGKHVRNIPLSRRRIHAESHALVILYTVQVGTSELCWILNKVC